MVDTGTNKVRCAEIKTQTIDNEIRQEKKKKKKKKKKRKKAVISLDLSQDRKIDKDVKTQEKGNGR